METKTNKKKKKSISEIVRIAEGVSVRLEGNEVIVKGKKSEVKRDFRYKQIELKLEGSQLMINSRRNTKREKTIIGSLKAHIKNMMSGANEPHKYILKICSGHFPMNVSVAKNEFIVKNLLGEKVPRVLRLKEGANVRIEGDIVTIEAADKEIAGQVAADIEKLTRRGNYDTRVFQDGIYIINKDGKDVK